MANTADIGIKLNFTPYLDPRYVNVVLRELQTSLGRFANIKLIDEAKVNAEFAKLREQAKQTGTEVEGLQDKLNNMSPGNKLAAAAFGFNQMNQAVAQVTSTVDGFLVVGREFEANVAALSAITGFSGKALNQLGDDARSLARDFGGSANDQLKSYQGILSKFGPDLAKNSAALKEVATNVNVLSAASGDAADTSMGAITDTMLQLGLVSEDTNVTAKNSRDVINALAAGAQVGAAEIPQVAQAMVQVGVAAKGANLGLVNTNAAIQVLSVGGKTGSEAGVALRNVLGLMQKASGPAEEAMKKLGTSSKDLGSILTDPSKGGLQGALEKIQNGLNGLGSDAERNATLMAIFGTENSAAAGILLNNTKLLSSYADGIRQGMEGQGSAFAQAAVRMSTGEAMLSRWKAQVQDVFIGIAQTVGGGVTASAGFVAQYAPLITTIIALKEPLGALTGGTKDLAVSLISKLMPSLITTSATSGAATISFQAMWAAATGPVGLAIAGIAAVIVATKFLADALHDTAAEKLEDANAEGELLRAQKEGVDAKAAAVGANLELVASYERAKAAGASTAEEQQRLADLTQKVAVAFPGAVDASNNFSISAEKLAEQAGKAQQQVFSLAKESNDLATKIAAQDKLVLSLQVDVAKEDLESKLTDIRTDLSATDWLKGIAVGIVPSLAADESFRTSAMKLGDNVSEFMFGTSFARKQSESFSKQFTDMVYNAKNSGDIAKASAEFAGAIAVNADKMGMSKQQQLEAIKSFNDFAKSKSEALKKSAEADAAFTKQQSESLSSYYEQATTAGSNVNDTIKNLAQSYGISEEKARSSILVSQLQKAGKEGKLTDDKIGGIAMMFGKTADEAKKLLAEEEKNTAEAAKTAENVKSIGTAFKEALDASKTKANENVFTIAALRTEYKTASKERQAQIKQEEANLVSSTRALAAQSKQGDKLLENIKTDVGLSEKKVKTGDSIYKRTKDVLDNEMAALEVDEQRLNFMNQQEVLEGKRKRNSADDLQSAFLKESTISNQVEATKKLLGITVQADGSFSFLGDSYKKEVARITELLKTADSTTKTELLKQRAEYIKKINEGVVFKDDKERNDATKLFLELQTKLSDARAKVQELKEKIVAEADKVEEELRKQKLQVIEIEVELGVRPQNDLVDAFEKELTRINESIKTADDKQKSDLLKQQSEYIKKIADIKKKWYEDDLKELEEKLKKEDEKNKKALEQQQRFLNAMVQSNYDANKINFASLRENELKKLDAQNNEGLISQKGYEAKKKQIEEQSANDMRVLDKKLEGERRAIAEAASISELERQKQDIAKKKKLAEDAGRSDDAQKFSEELDALQKQISDKQDVIASIGEQFTEMSNSFASSLFSEGWEAARGNLKDGLNSLGAYLQKYAAGVVGKIFMDWLIQTPLGPAAPFLSPLIYAGVYQLVKRFTDPLIAEITSFGTGGIVTQPTVAVVGDRHGSAGDQTEFILGSDQLRAVITSAYMAMVMPLLREIQALRQDIGGLRLTAVYEGSKMAAVLSKADQEEKRRYRGLTATVSTLSSAA